MRTIKIGDKEYVIEYTFEAAEHKNTVQKMFNVLTGAYALKSSVGAENEQDAAAGMIDGVSGMVADIPHIVKTAFYSGLLEHNPVSEEESKNLMKQYMKENKISYHKLFEDIKTYMEEDGFFDLSGLKEMVEKMNSSFEEVMKMQEEQK